jgi:GDPmannose 4,6-dehydratase
MSALRDWGHARDYVEMQWLMLQQETAEDFVIATGVQYSVRQFVEFSAKELGITLKFEGEGEAEVGRVAGIEPVKGEILAKCKVGDVIVKVDPRYYRPTEVETLLGDPTKAKEKLGWVPATTLQELVAEMVLSDYASAKRDSLVKLAGFQAYDHYE